MQVDLWLLDKNHLTRLGHSKRREDRKNLRDTQADVGDADKVLGAALLSLKCPAYLDFDLCVTDGRRSDLPCQTESLKVLTKIVDKCVVGRLRDDARNVRLKMTRKGAPDGRDGVEAFRIAPKPGNVNESPDYSVKSPGKAHGRKARWPFLRGKRQSKKHRLRRSSIVDPPGPRLRDL